MAETTPSILLGGKEYPVKQLVIAQLRVVVPAMQRLGRIKPDQMTQEQMDDLIEVLYQAVSPGQEKPLTRDEFMAIPASPIELILAIPVVAQQAGMELQKVDGPAGEAPAGRKRTGTGS